MFQNHSRAVCVLMTVALATVIFIPIAASPADAADTYASIASVEASPGSDTAVNVTVSGCLCGIQLDIAYDESILQYRSAVYFQDVDKGNFLANADAGHIRITWYNAKAVDYSGVLATLSFTLNGSATGSTALSMGWMLVEDDQTERMDTATGTVTAKGTAQGDATQLVSPDFYISSASGRTGDQVQVKLSVRNNAGIAGYVASISYDSKALELVSVDDCANSAYFIESTEKAGVVGISCIISNSSDLSGDRDLASLKFKVVSTADSDVSLTLTMGSVTNSGLQEVTGSSVSVHPGSVAVTNGGSPTANESQGSGSPFAVFAVIIVLLAVGMMIIRARARA